ncbi:MAG: TSUP family transporter [Vicinamibacterales bacterium]
MGIGGFDLLVALVGVAAGAIAAVSGFGIGSLLTPTLALQHDARLAVAAVSIPHLVGTALRFWMLRGHVDRTVLVRFGATSAAGALAGAAIGAFVRPAALRVLVGAMLVVVGSGEAAGWTRRMRFDGPMAWVAGAASGFFGGLIGNQGGLRAAAMLGFALPKAAFVATATAIALAVDAARMPVYALTEGAALAAVSPQIALATSGVVVGTLAGERLLRAIPERVFRRAVATLLIALGLLVLATA